MTYSIVVHFHCGNKYTQFEQCKRVSERELRSCNTKGVDVTLPGGFCESILKGDL